MGLILQKLAKAVKDSTKADGLNVIMNNESSAGQLVFHAHIHLIPRFEGDGFAHWRGQGNVTSADFANTQTKIISAL